MTTDAELLRRARSDALAFRELYDRYAARVFAFHRRRTRALDAAHDLTAETFAEAWESRPRARDEAGGSAGPWLFAIARHVLSTSVRRGRIERAACTRLGVLERLDREPSTAEPTEAWLDEALAELPATSSRRSSCGSSTTWPTTTSPPRCRRRPAPPAAASTAASPRSETD